ncbi:hypothetical protein MLD38_020348 [Melastoma candidum]|uniref:Uncharacterized protein n=1 Tax=Melastoma candidum TaxID=119954 RepID=A0ACB9QCS5_9MYRT|nr:hypothetical protein MLD38_020348 [Melastoma candidum]
MMPRKHWEVAIPGNSSTDGDLRDIRRQRFWPLNKLLVEKYELSEHDAAEMTDFLLPILDFVRDMPSAAVSPPSMAKRPTLFVATFFTSSSCGVRTRPVGGSFDMGGGGGGGGLR